jgi:hypothetical protein
MQDDGGQVIPSGARDLNHILHRSENRATLTALLLHDVAVGSIGQPGGLNRSARTEDSRSWTPWNL